MKACRILSFLAVPSTLSAPLNYFERRLTLRGSQALTLCISLFLAFNLCAPVSNASPVIETTPRLVQLVRKQKVKKGKKGKKSLPSNKILFRIMRPKTKRGSLLNSIDLRGCWVEEGLKRIVAQDKTGKRIRFKKTTETEYLRVTKIHGIRYPILVQLTFDSDVQDVQNLDSHGGELAAVFGPRCKSLKSKSARKQCRASGSTIEHTAIFATPNCVGPSDFETSTPQDGIVLLDGGEVEFHSMKDSLRFRLSRGEFFSDSSNFSVIVNGKTLFGESLTISDGVLSVLPVYLDGLNRVEVIVSNQDGEHFSQDFSVWVGPNKLNVKVVNQNSPPSY